MRQEYVGMDRRHHDLFEYVGVSTPMECIGLCMMESQCLSVAHRFLDARCDAHSCMFAFVAKMEAKLEASTSRF